MNEIIQQLETALQAAKDIQQAETQLMVLPELAKNTRMPHFEQSGHNQDLKAVIAGNLSAIKACIKEVHVSVREYETRGIKHRGLTKNVIFLHSQHNSTVDADYRA